MLVRERTTPEGLLVSVCDPDCVGETYEGENGVALDVTESFYAGEDATEATPEEVIDSLVRASVANIVGERAVGVAVEAGIVEEESVLDLDGTRHAQLLWL